MLKKSSMGIAGSWKRSLRPRKLISAHRCASACEPPASAMPLGASRPRGEHAPRIRRDPDLARLRAERRAMVDRAAGLVLPLMHHLVQQRVQRLLPSVPAQMRAADRDLGRLAAGVAAV